jgi:hypothetical protein
MKPANAPGVEVNRRQFLQGTLAAAGAMALTPPTTLAAPPQTAADQVTLGNTGIRLSRLGMGTGSNSGNRSSSISAARASTAWSATPTTRASPGSTAPRPTRPSNGWAAP